MSRPVCECKPVPLRRSPQKPKELAQHARFVVSDADDAKHPEQEHRHFAGHVPVLGGQRVWDWFRHWSKVYPNARIDDIQLDQNNREELLRKAIETENTLAVRVALNKQTSTDRKGLLLLAARKGDATLAKKLLKFDCVDVNEVLNTEHLRFGEENSIIRNETPLHAAARNGHSKVVKLLVKDSRCKINAEWKLIRSHYNHRGNFFTDKTYWANAMHLAAISGHIDVVKVLKNHGAEDMYFEDQYGEAPLHLASAMEDIQFPII